MEHSGFGIKSTPVLDKSRAIPGVLNSNTQVPMTTCPCRKAPLRARTFNFALREEPPLFPVRLKLGLHPRPFQYFTIDNMRGYFASEHRKNGSDCGIPHLPKALFRPAKRVRR